MHKEGSKVNLYELAEEYEKQYRIICAKVDAIAPLIEIYSGENLLLLRKKIKIYYDMASECKRISYMLSHYYDGDGDD